MNVAFKQDQVYRGDYTFRNSPRPSGAFRSVSEDRYMYSVNIEPHMGGPEGSVIEFPIDCDEHYVEECRERAIVIDNDPLRIQALPHMMSAQWDTLELGMQSLSQSYPDKFTLTRNGRNWHWINRPLELDRVHFRRAEESPVRAARVHHAGSCRAMVIMDQRDNDFGSKAHGHPGGHDWSMDFDMVMSVQGMARAGAAGARDGRVRCAR